MLVSIVILPGQWMDHVTTIHGQVFGRPPPPPENFWHLCLGLHNYEFVLLLLFG